MEKNKNEWNQSKKWVGKNIKMSDIAQKSCGVSQNYEWSHWKLWVEPVKNWVDSLKKISGTSENLSGHG